MQIEYDSYCKGSLIRPNFVAHANPHDFYLTLVVLNEVIGIIKHGKISSKEGNLVARFRVNVTSTKCLSLKTCYGLALELDTVRFPLQNLRISKVSPSFLQLDLFSLIDFTLCCSYRLRHKLTRILKIIMNIHTTISMTMIMMVILILTHIQRQAAVIQIPMGILHTVPIHTVKRLTMARVTHTMNIIPILILMEIMHILTNTATVFLPSVSVLMETWITTKWVYFQDSYVEKAKNFYQCFQNCISSPW